VGLRPRTSGLPRVMKVHGQLLDPMPVARSGKSPVEAGWRSLVCSMGRPGQPSGTILGQKSGPDFASAWLMSSFFVRE
jgi:hypothetical protein